SRWIAMRPSIFQVLHHERSSFVGVALLHRASNIDVLPSRMLEPLIIFQVTISAIDARLIAQPWNYLRPARVTHSINERHVKVMIRIKVGQSQISTIDGQHIDRALR